MTDEAREQLEEEIDTVFEEALEIVKERWAVKCQKVDGTITTWNDAFAVKFNAWGALKHCLENKDIIFQKRVIRFIFPDDRNPKEYTSIFSVNTHEEAIEYFKGIIRRRRMLCLQKQ